MKKNYNATFESVPYDTKNEALEYINSVLDTHTFEDGYDLVGEPEIILVNSKYVAYVTLQRKNEQKNSFGFSL